MTPQAQRAIEYIDNTGGKVSLHDFLDDYDPIGEMLLQELRQEGMVNVLDFDGTINLSYKGVQALPEKEAGKKKYLTTTDTAIICHEANRHYCAGIGDMSQKSWEDAPQWQRDSAVNGVVFHLNNPDALPSQSHENWLKEKLNDGWLYGAAKEPELKLHPCIVPFDQLPVVQQVKDMLFKSVVDSVRALVRF